MSNSISSTGTFSIGDASATQGRYSLSLTIPMTGSNLTLDIPNIISASAWQGLKTSSLTNLRYSVVVNNGTGSVILGTTNGAGLNPVLAPGDICIMPFYNVSGVTPLYANVKESTSSSVVSVGVAES